MNALQRLVKQVLTSEFLESEDRPVIKEVVYRLELDLHGFEDVNQKIQKQIEIEADMVYLLSKYRNVAAESKFDLEEEQAGVFLDSPRINNGGYKATANELKAYQLTHPDVAVKRRRNQAAQALYETLQEISMIVFGRNKKLNELSVNYRQELKADH